MPGDGLGRPFKGPPARFGIVPLPNAPFAGPLTGTVWRPRPGIRTATLCGLGILFSLQLARVTTAGRTLYAVTLLGGFIAAGAGSAAATSVLRSTRRDQHPVVLPPASAGARTGPHGRGGVARLCSHRGGSVLAARAENIAASSLPERSTCPAAGDQCWVRIRCTSRCGVAKGGIGDQRLCTVFLVVPVFLLYGATHSRQRSLARLVMTFAVVGCVLVLLAVATGYQLEGRPGLSIDPGDLAQATRIRPALLPLLFLATMITLGRISAGGIRAWHLVRLALFLSVWAVTYNRSSWVALVIAGTLLILIQARAPGPHP